MGFIQNLIVVSVLLIGGVFCFTPLGGFLPELILDLVPEFYWQYSLYEIFFEMHWQLTVVILMATGLVSTFTIIARGM